MTKQTAPEIIWTLDLAASMAARDPFQGPHPGNAIRRPTEAGTGHCSRILPLWAVARAVADLYCSDGTPRVYAPR